MRKHFLVTIGLVLASATGAMAWWVKGHGTIAEAAASRLPEAMPQFFRAAGKQLGHLAGDPDRWKNRDAKHLRAAEAPDHFIDLEDYAGNTLPADRYKAATLLRTLKQQPERTGMLPYAIMEDFDRLTCAFYDYRAEPENEAIRMKCIVYAGNLAHFTGDATMPLHTTRNYDGKPGPDGGMVQRGIHAKIDAFPEKNGLTAEEMGRGLEPVRIDDMWEYIVKRIDESHKLIDRCYELDAAGGFDKPTPESRALILERCRAAAQFTADVWYNAWLRSAKLAPHY
ncbi:MAG TPA: S1/P1 nuclease [Gemmataceae bacterium]|nr:S1/P1 nuclease [Gemmataceae bacterium]